MSSTVDNLYTKSLLFEIVDITGRILESFALIIPPTSITIEYGQRISRVKTFGGLFEDDYGEDNPTIVISGDTGGINIRSTVTQEGIQELDGLEAFYYLRDRIMRYKSRKQYESSFSSFSVRLYDLGTVRIDSSTPVGAIRSRAEAYEISLDPFRQKRDASRPFQYNYEIRAIVIRQLGDYKPAASPIDTSTDPISLIQKIRGTITDIRGFFTNIQDVFDKITTIIDFADSLLDQLYAFEDAISGALRSADGIITGTVDFGLRVATYPSEVARSALSVVNEVSILIEGYKNNYLDRESNYIISSYLAIIDDWNEVSDTWAYLATTGKSPSKATTYRVALSQELSSVQNYDGTTEVTDTDLERIQSSGITIENGEVVITGAFTLVPITSGDTFEILADNYLGSPDLAYVLAIINEVTDINDIGIGGTIKVPSASSNIEGNQVFSTGNYNVLGKDILVSSSSGSMSANADGDLRVVTGEANLVQAMNLRFNTELGTRLRLTLYGLKTSIGRPQTSLYGNSYVVSNLLDTIAQEPRIVNIQDLSFQGSGDALWIGFSAKTLGTESIKYTGGV